jgi:saccharopine dehydrogenase-like NADP-dependent oxidoreductase
MVKDMKKVLVLGATGQIAKWAVEMLANQKISSKPCLYVMQKKRYINSIECGCY